MLDNLSKNSKMQTLFNPYNNFMPLKYAQIAYYV